MADIIRSMSLPIDRTPTPCMSRLWVGFFPQASGKVSRTAVQKQTSSVQMPSTSVSPVATFLYGKRHPAGEFKLSSIAKTSDESVTTAERRSDAELEVRRMS